MNIPGRYSLLFMLCLMLFPAWAMSANMIKPFEPDSLQEITRQHIGKPFVLFVWSLDCEYCHASLEHLAQVQRGGRALAIVTLSTDPVQDPQALSMMEKRLKEVKLTRNAWAFGSTSPEKLKYALDPKWHGEKPRSYWFNAQGERIAYSGVLTPAMIEKMVMQVSK